MYHDYRSIDEVPDHLKKSYLTIADAAEVTGDSRYVGTVSKIWYAKRVMTRDFRMGYDFLAEEGGKTFGHTTVPRIPTLETLYETHVCIGSVGEKSLEGIFGMMQGHAWSPFGNARDIIQWAGTPFGPPNGRPPRDIPSPLGHTSMSVGDIVQQGDKLFMVDTMGFVEL